jgi:hypothetical protein
LRRVKEIDFKRARLGSQFFTSQEGGRKNILTVVGSCGIGAHQLAVMHPGQNVADPNLPYLTWRNGSPVDSVTGQPVDLFVSEQAEAELPVALEAVPA